MIRNDPSIFKFERYIFILFSTSKDIISYYLINRDSRILKAYLLQDPPKEKNENFERKNIFYL